MRVHVPTCLVKNASFMFLFFIEEVKTKKRKMRGKMLVNMSRSDKIIVKIL